MKLPIHAYGSNILRTSCSDVPIGYPRLTQLIADMWATMYNAQGCGLAAPQVGLPLNLFVVDTKIIYRYSTSRQKSQCFAEGDTGIEMVFINPTIISRSEKVWEDVEGCLSIPNMMESVSRPWSIEIEYYDLNFVHHVHAFSGTTARAIQHEYDHLQGVLFIDYLTSQSLSNIQHKLDRVEEGSVPTKYMMVKST